MSEMTKGGITVKVLTGRTAASLQRYRDAKEEGKEPCLLATTRHCAHDVKTQIAEWKRVREIHGTQGAKRTMKASYEAVDPDTGLHASGRRGTHVRYHDGKRWRKRPAGPGETPTHLRIEAGDLLVKGSEAVHTIYAASAELVNPDNPEDIARFWEAVNAERDELYPGLQESRWLERNGQSGLVHIHVASNATIYEDFSLDGVDYRAGRKMAGELTRVHSARAAFEQYLDAHPEHGLSQSLARVGTREYKDAQLRDGQQSYWESRRGKETVQDRIRRTAEEVLHEPGVVDHAGFVHEMRTRGIVVDETGLRRGKPGKGHDLRYRVATAKQGVKGGTLGPGFTHAAIGEQLDRKARGLQVEPLATKQLAGEPRPLPLTADRDALTAAEQAELVQLRAEVERLAQAARPRVVEIRDMGAPIDELFDNDMSFLDAYRTGRSTNGGLSQDQMQRLERGLQEALAAEVPLPRVTETASARARQEQSEPTVAVVADEHELPDVEQTVPELPEQGQPVLDEAPMATSTPDVPAQPAYRSALRDLNFEDEDKARRNDLLASLEEDYVARFEAGGAPDTEFERRVTEVAIGRATLENKIGKRLHPAVWAQLDRREMGKEVARAEFDRAKQATSDEQRDAHLENAKNVRALLKEGRYDESADFNGPTPRGVQPPLLTDAERQVLKWQTQQREVDTAIKLRDQNESKYTGLG